MDSSKDWKLKNPEKNKAINKSWRQRNKDKVIAHQRDYYANNKDKVKAVVSNWRKNAPWEKRQLLQIRQRSRQNGIEFDITIEDLLAIKVDVCPALGLTLNYSNTGKRLPETATVDRVDCSKGYTKSNIMILSWRANNLKRDASPDELKRLSDFLLTLPVTQ